MKFIDFVKRKQKDVDVEEAGQSLSYMTDEIARGRKEIIFFSCMPEIIAGGAKYNKHDIMPFWLVAVAGQDARNDDVLPLFLYKLLNFHNNRDHAWFINEELAKLPVLKDFIKHMLSSIADRNENNPIPISQLEMCNLMEGAWACYDLENNPRNLDVKDSLPDRKKCYTEAIQAILNYEPTKQEKEVRTMSAAAAGIEGEKEAQAQVVTKSEEGGMPKNNKKWAKVKIGSWENVLLKDCLNPVFWAAIKPSGFETCGKIAAFGSAKNLAKEIEGLSMSSAEAIYEQVMFVKRNLD